MTSSTRSAKFVEKYREDFDDVLRVLELSDGFVLLPIAVPGPDLGVLLARWLLEKGHPTFVLAPETDEEWKNVASALLSAKAEPHGSVMFLVGSDISTDLSLPLRLVNERRDAIAKHLNCPLLWCGSAEFLVQTGQMAPDFWSIRAVERRMERRAKKESKLVTEDKKPAQPDLLDDAIDQDDRKSAEILFLVRLRKIMAVGSQDEFAEAIANIPKLLENADPTFAFELTLMKAEMARRRGNIADAIEMLDALEEKIKSPEEECRIDLLRGRVWERAGDFKRAEAAYGRAYGNTEVGDDVWAILAGEYYGRMLSRSNSLPWNDEILERRTLSSTLGGKPSQALHCAMLSEIAARNHDLRQARYLLTKATGLHKDSVHSPTVLFGGEVAEAIVAAEEAIAHGQESAASQPLSVDIRWFDRLKDRRLNIVLLLTLGLFVIYALKLRIAGENTIQRGNVHCFRGLDKEIICGESLEQCEEFRAALGAKSPCQKPLFAPSTP